MVARFHSRPKSVFYTPCVENGGDLRFPAVFFHERLIDPADVRQYLIDAGANSDYLDLEPHNYVEVFEPKSVDELQRIVGGEGSGARVDFDVPF